MTEAVLLPALSTGGLLLVVAGVAKLRDPLPALESSIPPHRRRAGSVSRTVVRALGAGEAFTGAAVLVSPAPVVFVVVAALYASFAIVTEWQRRQPWSSSCGCLGARSAPASRLHGALNVALAAVAILAAVWPPAAWTEVAATAPATFAVAGIGTLAATALAAVAIRDLTTHLSSYRRPAADLRAW